MKTAAAKTMARTTKETASSSGPPWDIAAWCERAHISKAKLFELWTRGLGPRRRKIDTRVLVIEDPLKWALRVGVNPDAAGALKNVRAAG